MLTLSMQLPDQESQHRLYGEFQARGPWES